MIKIRPNADNHGRNKFGSRLSGGFLLLTVCLQTTVYATPNAELPPARQEYSRSEALYSIPNLEMTRQDQTTTWFPKEIDDGRPVILTFIFTSCSAICPMLSGILSSVQNKLGDEIQNVHIVSVSIDPEYDNAERLREYAVKFNAKPQWQFYTGTLENVQALQKAFHAFRGDKMKHTATIFLRDTPGKPWIRLDGFLNANDIIAEYQKLKPETGQ